jgi:aminoglycoside phosphotransferase (APT) family kinase protein
MSELLALLQQRLSDTLGGSWSITGFAPLHEGRSVASLTTSRPPHETVVAKFYRDQADSTRACRALSLVSDRSARSSTLPTLRTPGVLLHDESLAVLVQSAAPGEPLTRMTSTLAPERMRRVGRALAELHRLPAHGVVPRQLHDHIAELVRPAPEQLAAVLPKHARLIERALDWMHQKDAACPSTSHPVLLHRDFQLRQLFASETHVTVVDWDDLAAGDPSFDIYYLVAYLRSHLADGAADACERAFLAGYHELSPASAAHRRELWLAFNHLRRAARRFRLRDDDWEASLARSLDALSALVAREPAG